MDSNTKIKGDVIHGNGKKTQNKKGKTNHMEKKHDAELKQ